MRFLPLIAPLALVVAACSSVAGPDAGSTSVEVTATYRERIMLPPGHVLTVKVEDVSLMDAPSRVVAETSKPLEGRAPPYAVSLSVPTAQINPRNTYAVRAEIRDPAGALRFTTDTRHSVLTQGASNKVDIVMVGVR
ncbi:YbaY family lipoprotein [Brevundimonas faecalis]|uniref:Lipoprotein n=1 Tax=Brevundimonas faecalis TaxID=947378 RepID=A0ABV2RE67_9CAUL